MQIRSTAPRHLINKYLRGGCFVLAIELHKRAGLPLWGMKATPGGEIHHAFVADPVNGIAVDIRGGMLMGEVSQGARLRDPIFEPISVEEIMAQVFSFDPQDVKEARRIIRSHFSDLSRMIEVPRQCDQSTFDP